MWVRPVVPADLVEVDAWFSGARLRSLPPTGFIVPGVAAGFLAKTDCGVALVEAYFTNPDAPAEKRSEAIDLVTTMLIAQATLDGFESIIGITDNDNLKDRAVARHGFTYAGQKHGLIREI